MELMKKFLPLVFLAALITGYLALLRLPYHFYREAVTTGVSSRFLHLEKMPDLFYMGEAYQISRMMGINSDELNLWEDLHFNDFEIPFPVKHPSFLVTPIIYREAGTHRFGYNILNFEKEEINRVIFHDKYRFRLELHENLIFSLPVFERTILRRGLEQIWHDLYRKNIFRSAFLKEPEWLENLNPMNIPLNDMVYDLFILSLRQKYFPKNTKTIQYWPKKKLGILEVESNEVKEDKPVRYLQELIHFPVQDQVHVIELRTLLEDFPAEKYRQRFFKNIKFKESYKEASIPLYSKFQKLDYQDKFTPTGLLFLYSAFSHQKDSKSFLRQSIQFMERGKNDRIYLDPFYRYGYDLYGSNFSQIINKRVETQAEKLERKKREEEDKRRAEIEGREVDVGADKFDSVESKINFFLQNAKESGEPEKEKTPMRLD